MQWEKRYSNLQAVCRGIEDVNFELFLVTKYEEAYERAMIFPYVFIFSSTFWTVYLFSFPKKSDQIIYYLLLFFYAYNVCYTKEKLCMTNLRPIMAFEKPPLISCSDAWLYTHRKKNTSQVDSFILVPKKLPTSMRYIDLFLPGCGYLTRILNYFWVNRKTIKIYGFPFHIFNQLLKRKCVRCTQFCSY